VYTDDPHTVLRPGDEGTVVRHDENTATVDIRRPGTTGCT
jgi:hypothetical protein